MKHSALIFEKPYRVVLKAESLPAPKAKEVLIKTKFSAISAGSELLVYRGQFPPRLPVDAQIKVLSKPFRYPLKYGYVSVGEVVAVGSAGKNGWLGRQVFCFHPHESHYVAPLTELIAIPEDIDLMDALFLAHMETAVNFMMDGRPVIGEKVLIFGQGIVGLLTTALLAQFPLLQLFTLDCYAARRQASLAAGADSAMDPDDPSIASETAGSRSKNSSTCAPDLVYELSGNPQALNRAVTITGFGARVVIGSWYGSKQAHLDLGGPFHRNRIQLISSQVSTLSPAFSGRWTKNRRLEIAWDMIRKIRPVKFITHQYPLSRAKEAYELLDKNPQEAIQVVFTYDP